MIKIINFKKVISIFLLLLWLTIIFLFSNTPSGASEEQSKTIVNHIMGTQTQSTDIQQEKVESEEIIEPKEKTVDLEYLNYLIRKIAHMSEYFILSLLVINVIIQFKGKIKYKHYIISICFCLIYAITDELHQTFVPGRCGQAIDVFIDTFGAILGCCAFKLIIFRKKSNIEGR